MAIFGISFVSLFAGISSSFSIIKAAREDLRATQILAEKMETIRLYTWDQINTAGFIPGTFTEYYYDDGSQGGNKGVTYYGTMAIRSANFGTSYSTNMRQVVVNIQWASDSGIHKREMSSLITRDGLQDYIY